MIIKKKIVFGGDFNLIFGSKFDAPGENPILKKKLKDMPTRGKGFWKFSNFFNFK